MLLPGPHTIGLVFVAVPFVIIVMLFVVIGAGVFVILVIAVLGSQGGRRQRYGRDKDGTQKGCLPKMGNYCSHIQGEARVGPCQLQFSDWRAWSRVIESSLQCYSIPSARPRSQAGLEHIS